MLIPWVLGSAAGDSEFSFILTADQVVPPTASSATGRAVATLDANETQVVFVLEHSVGQPTGITVHAGNWGTNGPVIHTLDSAASPVVDTWSPSPAHVTALKTGGLYLTVTSSSHPDGELRGQIDVNPDPQPGDVIITEIMYDPDSFEDADVPAPEWIELFNTTNTDIDIGGWYFQDEDVAPAAPCTPLRSGLIPPFVLHAFEVVVIIPDGASPNQPTVADFKSAWGLDAKASVLRLNADGTAGGALVAAGLDNRPHNDGEPANDLPLVSTQWQPCNPAGAVRSDNEILTLSDGAKIIDLVNFGFDPRTGLSSAWPPATTFSSITLVPGDYPAAPPQDFLTYSGAGNDVGANWIAHQVGDTAGGLRQERTAGVYGGRDVGSPCYLFGATSGNRAPVAFGQSLTGSPGGVIDIELAGTDATRPFFGLLLFVIKSLPADGRLIDTTSNRELTASDVAGFGYIVPRPPFNTLRYENNGACTADAMTFTAYDGLLESPLERVDLLVQCGGVAITEIMYDPDSTEAPAGAAEWIELFNYGEDAIDLAGWYLSDGAARSGAFPPFVLAAGATAVAIPRSVHPAEFTDAWCTPDFDDPPCPHDALILSTDGPRRVTPGEWFTVSLHQANLQTAMRGVQVFAAYDHLRLQHVATQLYTCPGTCPPDPIAPYNLVLRNEVAGGHIDLALGIEDLIGQAPTMADAPLATYTFEAGGQEGPVRVHFRDADPPSRFADESGHAIEPCLRDARPVWIDATPDDCPHDVLEFRLAPGSSRVRPGEQVVVELHQRDLSRPVRGYQLFAHFDSDLLTHVSTHFESCAGTCPPDLRTPYGRVLLNEVNTDNIGLAAGIDDLAGQLPTQADALLATLVFEARTASGVTSIDFRPHDPPTRFADTNGLELLPCRVDSPAITIAPTGPSGCPLIQAGTNGLTDGDGIVGAALDNFTGMVQLHAPGALIDAVAYRHGLVNPEWPAAACEGPSIYVRPDSGYTTYSNDDPASWAASTSGLHGAYGVHATSTFDGADVGSPAVLADVVQGACNEYGPLFDGNRDGTLDLRDFDHFVRCHRGPAGSLPANCGCFDWDVDGDVDLRDANHLLQAF